MGATALKINRLEAEIFDLADEIENSPFKPMAEVLYLKTRINEKRAERNFLVQDLEREVSEPDQCSGFAPA